MDHLTKMKRAVIIIGAAYIICGFVLTITLILDPISELIWQQWKESKEIGFWVD